MRLLLRKVSFLMICIVWVISIDLETRTFFLSLPFVITCSIFSNLVLQNVRNIEVTEDVIKMSTFFAEGLNSVSDQNKENWVKASKPVKKKHSLWLDPLHTFLDLEFPIVLPSIHSSCGYSISWVTLSRLLPSLSISF